MDRVTEMDLRVRFTDVDSQRVVHNARYLDYFAEVRLEHLRRVAGVESTGESGRPNFTVAEVTCRYKAPLRFRDELRLRCWTSEIRNRSFLLAYDIVKQESNEVVAEGSTAQVWLGTDQKAATLPDEVRDALQASL